MKKIPMSRPDIGTAEKQAVLKALESTQLTLGPIGRKFEDEFARFIGTQHAVCISSGTGGLHLSIIASGISAGDLVITTPFSFVAPANVLLYERAIPIFVDVDPVTGNIDPAIAAEAARCLMQGGSQARRWMPPAFRSGDPAEHRLKGLLPVHVFGQPAAMGSLREIAREHALAVVEDACEAIGAECEGQKVGAAGDLAVFAFYPNKQMTSGEGAMVVTDREETARLLRSLRNQGQDRFDGTLTHDRLGYNYRLNELSAALGLAQLQRIDELLAKREQVAQWYAERLEGVEQLRLLRGDNRNTRLSWFVYVIRLEPSVDRQSIAGELKASGIPTRPYFPPIHLQPFYVDRFGYQPGDFPEAEALGASCLALPFSSSMAEDEVDYVCRHLRTALLH